MATEEVQLKRPRNAYLLFTLDKREEVKTDNPDAPAKLILKLLGEEWNKLSSEQKVPYTDKAKAEKQVYDDAIAAGATRPQSKKRKAPKAQKAKEAKIE